MWQPSAPSNQITLTHQHNSQVEASPSDPPELPMEETLESQVEYPREVVEGVEEVEVAEEAVVSPMQHQHNKQLLMEETNSSAIHRSYSPEIARNRKRS